MKEIKWLKEEAFLGENKLEDIIYKYIELKEVTKIEEADKLVNTLDKTIVYKVMDNLYNLWLENEALAKYKSILIPYILYGKKENIITLKDYIKKNPNRGELAEFIIKIFLLEGSDFALFTIDNIAERFTKSRIRNAAVRAFRHFAKERQIDEEILKDKIIPDLGFSKNGEIIYEEYNKSYTFRLISLDNIEIIDNIKNKTIKTIPKSKAKDIYSNLKHSLKEIVSFQTFRLKKSVLFKREWDKTSFENVFINNPIMRLLASKLIWISHDIKSATHESFKYNEDNTYCDCNDNEYKLKDDTNIYLMYPSDLENYILEKWKSLFRDYEILFLFNQLNMKVFDFKKEDVKNNKITILNGSKVYISQFKSMYAEMKLELTCFGYIFKSNNLAIVIEMEHIYMEGYILGDISFYNIDDIKIKDDYSEYFEEKDILNPFDIDKRFISAFLSVLSSYIAN